MLKRRLLFGAKNVDVVAKTQEYMQLLDKIHSDVVTALKAGDSKKANALRYLLSLVDKKAFNLPLGSKLSEGEVLGVLQKELKNKEESKSIFEKAGREELAGESEWEINLLKSYLPTMLSREEIKAIILEIVASGEKNFGNIMRQTMVKGGGRADGNIVSLVVKEVLGN